MGPLTISELITKLQELSEKACSPHVVTNIQDAELNSGGYVNIRLMTVREPVSMDYAMELVNVIDQNIYELKTEIKDIRDREIKQDIAQKEMDT